MNNVTDKLKKYASKTPSKWREEAESRMVNKSWLRHSQRVAMLMLDQMERKGITQKQLAELMTCSQQYVSKILKGKENLSLETLSKIEEVLSINIFALAE